jgi:ABC-type nickel/cobalt efflux system permease component RcnA
VILECMSAVAAALLIGCGAACGVWRVIQAIRRWNHERRHGEDRSWPRL